MTIQYTIVGNYLIIIGGPTASGKTSLSLELANYFDTEILSCDSRQFYREMNIGTAKPTAAELSRAPHHFVNHLSIHHNYTVGDYEREVIQWLKNWYQNASVAILVGGSGLFVNAVTDGLNKFPNVPQKIRDDLSMLYEKEGLAVLQSELKALDPVHYAQVDIQNPRRLLRALEVCRTTNLPFSHFTQQARPQRNFDPIRIYIDWEREQLYDRINRRVDIMMEEGLLEEAEALLPYRQLKSLQTVGYQELFRYFDGELTMAEAVELIKRNSRRYAKRQLTWLRRESEKWRGFAPDQLGEVSAYLSEQMSEKG